MPSRERFLMYLQENEGVAPAPSRKLSQSITHHAATLVHSVMAPLVRKTLKRFTL